MYNTNSLRKSSFQFQLPEEGDPIYEASKYSISIVPEELRKRNENAYLPKRTTIGPLCMGTITGPEQRLLADCKLISMEVLCGKNFSTDPQKKLEECMEAILRLDGVVRQSYAEDIKLDSKALASVILADGCFLLQELLDNGDDYGDNDSDDDYDYVVNFSDLILLENQIPLFILRKLSEMLSIRELQSDLQIECQARRLLGYPPSSATSNSITDAPAAHLLELAYSFIPDPDDRVEHDVESIHVANDHNKELEGEELNRCATRLEAAGMKIKPGVAAKHKISFNFGISFQDGTLEIPPLHITESKGRRWLNLIAWEHHINKMKGKCGRGRRTRGSTSSCKCTWAALFFSALICSPSDVQLLKDRGVIVDHRGMSNLRFLEYFRSITMGVDHGIVVGSRYNKILDALNKYHRSPTNRVTEIPIRLWHYWTGLPQQITRDLRNFMQRGYNLAVSAITFLTVVQTVYAVISYHYPKQ